MNTKTLTDINRSTSQHELKIVIHVVQEKLFCFLPPLSLTMLQFEPKYSCMQFFSRSFRQFKCSHYNKAKFISLRWYEIVYILWNKCYLSLLCMASGCAFFPLTLQLLYFQFCKIQGGRKRELCVIALAFRALCPPEGVKEMNGQCTGSCAVVKLYIHTCKHTLYIFIVFYILIFSFFCKYNSIFVPKF